MRRLAILLALAACTTESSTEYVDLVPEGAVGKADGVCPTVPARIAPQSAPQYSCGPVDPLHDHLLDDVNNFWGSDVGLCGCGPDFPQDCDGAFSLFHTGWVYVGNQFMTDLVSSSGSEMLGAYVMAHEFGHEIQGHYRGAYAATTLQRELGADCLSGYYLGSLLCRNAVTERDVITTLRAACLIADGTGDPVADLETHGTCDQRVNATVAGMRAYLTNQQPLRACAY